MMSLTSEVKICGVTILRNGLYRPRRFFDPVVECIPRVSSVGAQFR